MLALGICVGAAGMAQPAYAAAPPAFDYDGDTIEFVDVNADPGGFGMWKDVGTKEGVSSSYTLLENGTLKALRASSNNTVYAGFLLNASIKDNASTKPSDVEKQANWFPNTTEANLPTFELDTSYFGKAWPVAVIKMEARGGGTTSKQIYLAIPSLDKLKGSLGYCAVTFTDGLGATLKTAYVKKGEGASAPSAPARTGYVFEGWDADFSNVPSDLTVNAKLTRVFKVTFTDGAGTTLKTQTVKEGEAATAPSNPTRSGYTFAGWDKDFSKISQDTTVNAKWDSNAYTITWVVDGKKTTSQADYNTLPAYPGGTPTKAQTAEYTYTFSGWDPTVKAATADATYTAKFTSKKRTYTVTFDDGIGGKTTQTVEYGAAAKAPADPKREGYVFGGWDKDFSKITGNLTVNAKWSLKKYKVSFYYNDGTQESDYGKLLKEEEVEHGKGATAPEDPTREGWVFGGWDPVSFDNITRNTIVLAVWLEPGVTYYTVSFTDGNGYTYASPRVKEGAAAPAPDNPTRMGYTFVGWDKGFAKVTEDLTVNAQWEPKTYTVSFTDGQGKEIKSQSVAYEQAATAPADPVREGYTFAGWDREFSSIKGDVVVNATWAINSYKVTFTDGQGGELGTQSVEYGSAAAPPAVPEREGYTFKEWDAPFDGIVADTTINAVWKPKTYKVTFTDGQGTVVSTQTVEYGSSATEPSVDREGYTFKEWDAALGPIASDTTINAVWAIATYTVTFSDGQGNTLKDETVEYGGSATPPDDPTREGYSFEGWNGTYANVKADATVEAQWKKVEVAPDENALVANARALINKLPKDPRTVTKTSVDIQAAGKAYNALPADLQSQLTADERMWLVKVLIAALESDPYAVTGDADGSIAMAKAAYDSLPQNLQNVLDGDYDPPQPDNKETNPDSLIRSSRTYGRYLENNVWAINALAGLDDATTLADGTYSGASKVASDSNMGKSRSPRNKKFLIYQVVVKDGRAMAIIEHDSNASDTLHMDGKEYKNRNTGDGTFPNDHSYYQIPVDLNTTFYFSVKGKEATSETDAITYEMIVTIDEANAQPDAPKEEQTDDSKDGSGNGKDAKGNDSNESQGKGGKAEGGSSEGAADASGGADNSGGSGGGSGSGSAGQVAGGGNTTPSLGLAGGSVQSQAAASSASGTQSLSSRSGSSSSSAASSSSSAKESSKATSAAASSSKKDAAAAGTAGSSSSRNRNASDSDDVAALDALVYESEIAPAPQASLLPAVVGIALLATSLGALAFACRFAQRERRNAARATSLQGVWGA
ncbi:MAG: InlB B-repeat-containing protein [Eggerthellaceae bacterium]|nr:InlB B-repeat-containing protein [Eggerthellaceae bacterium]